MCGPIGSFRDQINYFGDFRVVFDALFPGRIPPGAVEIPPQVRANWSEIYRAQVIPALTDPANRQKVQELFAITGAPFDPNNPHTIKSTARGVLGYNIFATGDGGVFCGAVRAAAETTLVDGPDLVLHLPTAFSTGFQKDPLGPDGRKRRQHYGPSLRAFGHPGAGGSLAFADPESRIGFAYVMNLVAPGVMPGERASSS